MKRYLCGLILKCAVDNVLCLSSECRVADKAMQTTTSFFEDEANIYLNFGNV